MGRASYIMQRFWRQGYRRADMNAGERPKEAGMQEVSIATLVERMTGQERVSAARMESLLSLIDFQAHTAALAQEAADKAVSKAEHAMEKRFDAVNEFRAQLADQAGSFATRESVDARINAVEQSTRNTADALNARIDMLERWQERSSGRGAGLQAGWGYIVTAFGLALTVATLVIIFTRR